MGNEKNVVRNPSAPIELNATSDPNISTFYRQIRPNKGEKNFIKRRFDEIVHDFAFSALHHPM